MQYDDWHTLEIENDAFELTGHTADCPSYPNGPDSEHTAFGCATGSKLDAHGLKGFYELCGLTDGTYQVRHWVELSVIYPGGPSAEGFEVKSP